MKFSLSLSLEVGGRNDLRWWFCTKTEESEASYALPWPKGEYCVMKKGNCPTGMHSPWLCNSAQVKHKIITYTLNIFLLIFKLTTISPLLQGGTAKCSFLRTNMQCGFIKVIRMKRGSSNCKMIVAL